MADKLRLSWDDIELAISNLIPQLRQTKLIIGIARGGLIPAVMLSNRLGVPMTMVEASSYNSDLKRGKLTLNIPTHIMSNADTKHVTIVDDILDTGTTMEAIQPVWPHSTAAVLVSKKPNALMPHHFVFSVSSETWVIFPWE